MYVFSPFNRKFSEARQRQRQWRAACAGIVTRRTLSMLPLTHAVNEKMLDFPFYRQEHQGQADSLTFHAEHSGVSI